jgi:hypothetical protein
VPHPVARAQGGVAVEQVRVLGQACSGREHSLDQVPHWRQPTPVAGSAQARLHHACPWQALTRGLYGWRCWRGVRAGVLGLGRLADVVVRCGARLGVVAVPGRAGQVPVSAAPGGQQAAAPFCCAAQAQGTHVPLADPMT